MNLDKAIVRQSRIVEFINLVKEKQNNVQITRSGAYINYSDLGENIELLRANLNAVMNKFTIQHKLIMGNYVKIVRYRADPEKKRIIVPRFGSAIILNGKYGLGNVGVKNLISEGQDPKLEFKWGGQLDRNQTIISNYIMENFYNATTVKNGYAGLILNLEPGKGKSYIAAHLITRINKKTAIILHSTSILGQWQKLLKILFPSHKIGAYYAKEKTDGDIVLMIIDSALSEKFELGKNKKKAPKVEAEQTKKIAKKKAAAAAVAANVPNEEAADPLTYFKQFGFIIFDECHEYANNWAGGVFKVAQAQYMLGLSATPDENAKGFDPVVHWEIGPVIRADCIPGYSSLDATFKAEITRCQYYGPPDYTQLIVNETTMLTNVAATINMVCVDPHRASLVLECIKNCVEAGLYTFVFADRKVYLEALRRLYIAKYTTNAEALYSDDDYRRIVGGAKESEFQVAELKSRVIFTTYQYMGTGKSIPKMNAMVVATPRKTKIKQYYNRIFRLGSDLNIVRKIYYIDDMRTVLKGQWSHNKKYLVSMGYKIVEKKYEFGDLENSHISEYWPASESNKIIVDYSNKMGAHNTNSLNGTNQNNQVGEDQTGEDVKESFIENWLATYEKNNL